MCDGVVRLQESLIYFPDSFPTTAAANWLQSWLETLAESILFVWKSSIKFCQ